MGLIRLAACCLCLLSLGLQGQEEHVHSAPEKLGTVSFPISCRPAVQTKFNRGVALLHSFAYKPAEDAFQSIAGEDPKCAMAHWGVAVAQFHQLWEPPLTTESTSVLRKELEQARALGTSSHRERHYIDALALMGDGNVAYQAKVVSYQRAACAIAAGDRKDTEAQVFCALALLASASPQDKSHRNQKNAADILEPLSRTMPDHPGIPHYLIHAYDNAELAPRGLAAARVYSKIAPSAPHALHMPSHIFTRLGLWDDSIASNRAARRAAHEQGDTGEEFHAMDYLEYAYLQQQREREAEELVRELDNISTPGGRDFKIAYAATAMPIRYAVERGRWMDAAQIPDPAEAPPHVAALAVWARGLGLARTGKIREAQREYETLVRIEKQLRDTGSEYWATQVGILAREVSAWTKRAERKDEEAVKLLRSAADEEDSIEKLPVTPGPIVPAREQLGYLLLEQGRAKDALKEFRASLVLAPGRLGALRGISLASSSQGAQ